MVKYPVKKPKCASMNPACNTINLAKEGLTPEERKTKLLIYEKERSTPIMKPKPECLLPVGITLTPKTVKRIRMCTAQDIKTTCPPPMCTCIPRKPPMTPGEIFKKSLKLGIKTAIVGGIVYTTWQMGIWGSAKDSECVWNALKKTAMGPDVDEGAPCTDRNIHGVKEKWNYVISKTFLCLACSAKSVKSYINPEPEDCDPEQRSKDASERAKKDPCTCK